MGNSCGHPPAVVEDGKQPPARSLDAQAAKVEGNGQAVAASAPGGPAGAKAASPPERRSAAQAAARPATPSQPAARACAGAEAACVGAAPAPQALPLRSAFAAAAGDASGVAGADDFAAPRTQLTCSTSASEHARVACRRTSSTGGLLIEPRPSQCIASCSRASSGGLPFELRGAELGDTRNMGSLGGLSMASSLSSPGRSLTNMPVETPFEDLELRSLLSRGSIYGRLYQASWRGATVAVKVIRDVTNVRFHGSEPLEATLTSGGGHPCVLRTLAFSWYSNLSRLPRSVKLGRQALALQQPSQSWDSVSSTGVPNAKGAITDACSELWMIVEFCDRGTLGAAIERGLLRANAGASKGPPNLPLVLSLAAQIAEGMSFLHSCDVLHGDLCGDKVLLASAMEEGPNALHAKVAEFGMAREMQMQSKHQTRTYGTITHMAPEVLVNNIVTKSTDMYSMGCLLWELYACQRAWAGLLPPQVIIKVGIQKQRLPPLATAPPEFQELVTSCTDPDPWERPAFSDVATRLRRLAAEA